MKLLFFSTIICTGLGLNQVSLAQMQSDETDIDLPILQPGEQITKNSETIEISVNDLAISDNEVTKIDELDTAIIDLTDETQTSLIQSVDNITDNSIIDGPNILLEQSDIAVLLNNTSGSIFWGGIDNRLRSRSEVQRLYRGVGYQPLWTDSGYLTALGATLIKSTKEAWTHALMPETYHTAVTSNLSAGQVINEANQLDIILTDAFITYKKHLSNGIVDPKRQFKYWNTDPEQLNFIDLYYDAKQTGSTNSILDVKNEDYKYLQQAYIEAKSSKEKIAKQQRVPASKLKYGQKDAAVLVLRQRLNLPTDSDIYDKQVLEAVKTYQKQHGLGVDGIAGRRTISHINGDHNGKGDADKIAINMERMRWQQSVPTGNYIWVNIPAYKMAVRNGSEYLFTSNVIVGRNKRQTPVFSDRLEYVVLAPYWNVPKTIFREDKLPKLQKNPHALGNNMQVIDKSSGKVVPASAVNWKAGGEGYRLRQLPGPRNSLGRMKFLFPNKHAIYLHDTPNRRLFKKHNRAFSSGCIRVERAEDLSLFLLEDIGYNRQRIKKESRQKKEKWLKLDQGKQYPVFLDYYTVWPDEIGNIHYSRDIYGYDKPLKDMYQLALRQL